MKTVVPLRVLTTITAVTFVTAVAAFSGAIITHSHGLLVTGLMAATVAVWTDQRRSARLMTDQVAEVGDRYKKIVAFWQADIDALTHGTERPDPNLLSLPSPREPEVRTTPRTR